MKHSPDRFQVLSQCKVPCGHRVPAGKSCELSDWSFDSSGTSRHEVSSLLSRSSFLWHSTPSNSRCSVLAWYFIVTPAISTSNHFLSNLVWPLTRGCHGLGRASRLGLGVAPVSRSIHNGRRLKDPSTQLCNCKLVARACRGSDSVERSWRWVQKPLNSTELALQPQNCPNWLGSMLKECERVPPETRSEGTNPRTGIQFRYLRSASADISLQLLCREADLLVKDSRLRVHLTVR